MTILLHNASASSPVQRVCSLGALILNFRTNWALFKIPPTIRCKPAFQSLKRLTQKTDWLRTPIFGADRIR